jgi:hypothetical protein
MISIIIFILIALFANRESSFDFTKIKNHEKINHIQSWIYRATFVIFIILLTNLSIFNKIILSIGSAFLFSSIFRARLNHRRKKDLTYISNSNYYDSFFIKLFPKKHGMMIYVVEIIIFVTSTIIYIVTNNG